MSDVKDQVRNATEAVIQQAQSLVSAPTTSGAMSISSSSNKSSSDTAAENAIVDWVGSAITNIGVGGVTGA